MGGADVGRKVKDKASANVRQHENPQSKNRSRKPDLSSTLQPSSLRSRPSPASSEPVAQNSSSRLKHSARSIC